MPEISRIKLPNGDSSYYDIKDAAARNVIGATTLPTQGNIKDKTHQQRIASIESKVDTLASTSISYKVASALPTATAQLINIIYLVPSTIQTQQNIHDEYMITETEKTTTNPDDGTQTKVKVYEWQMIGSTQLDLSNYAQQGDDVTVNSSKTSMYVASSEASGGTVTAGVAASYDLPTFSATMGTGENNETLILSWNAGTFTPNTPTNVTLPTFSSTDIVTGIASAKITEKSEGD